jgi:hypothetical protein
MLDVADVQGLYDSGLSPVSLDRGRGVKASAEPFRLT